MHPHPHLVCLFCRGRQGMSSREAFAKRRCRACAMEYSELPCRCNCPIYIAPCHGTSPGASTRAADAAHGASQCELHVRLHQTHGPPSQKPNKPTAKSRRAFNSAPPISPQSPSTYITSHGRPWASMGRSVLFYIGDTESILRGI